MNNKFLNKIINEDCISNLDYLDDNSIDLFLSDIPYGINLDEWDVLHSNTNSALLGNSPAQLGKSGFKKRGKPINGWNKADKNINLEYQQWCYSWASKIYPKLKEGASIFIFGSRRTLHRAIIAFEDSGFLTRDVLARKKKNAHYRAQKLSPILRKRGLDEEARKWNGWKLGNLAPIYEPIAWLFKPYKNTITDNIIKNKLGAMNIEFNLINGKNPTNLLEFSFLEHEKRIHEAQKPELLIEFLIKLTTIPNQTILDPFMGSGTTAYCARKLNRNFIGFEINKEYFQNSILRLEKQLELENNLFI